MQWYHVTLLMMAAIATALAWRVPWAARIVGAGSFLAVLTSVWHSSGLPYGVLFGGFTNLLMCTGLSLIRIWPENNSSIMIDRVFRCYILMILIDLLFVTRIIETQYIFAVSLEVVNAYALILIGATGVIERIGDGRTSRHPDRGILAYLNRALLAPSKAYPRWWEHS